MGARPRGHKTSVTRFHADDALPHSDPMEALIIMGGPMGVYEADQYPWMKGEMDFIRQAIDDGKKVLGICLGAQLIAGALGANVYPHAQKEIGWWPVHFNAAAKSTALDVFGSQAMMYHWHGDTFDLPVGAVHLAASAACQNQAYALGKNVLALQFHPEISAETIGRWVQESGSIKNPGGTVMDEAEMKRLASVHLPLLKMSLFRFLDQFFKE